MPKKIGRPRKANPSKSNKAERKWYSTNKEYKKPRANSRNKARRKMGDPSGEVHHKDGNPENNSRQNLILAIKNHGRKTYSRKKPTKMKNKINKKK